MFDAASDEMCPKQLIIGRKNFENLKWKKWEMGLERLINCLGWAWNFRHLLSLGLHRHIPGVMVTRGVGFGFSVEV